MDAKELYARIGFGQRIGFGERPALLLIDFYYGSTDPSLPLGFDQSAAIRETRRLLEFFRERKLPRFYTTVAYTEGGEDGAWFVRKVHALRQNVIGSRNARIDERLKPREDEPVLEKKFASAFFGTPLHAILTYLKVDTVVLTGNSTSGCIRATCVDACSYGYRPMVVRECVSDRDELVHQVSLFDMDAKYGDVVSVEDVLRAYGG